MLHSATVEHARTSGALGAAKNIPVGGGGSWSAAAAVATAHRSRRPSQVGLASTTLIQHLRLCDIIPARQQAKGQG